MSKQARTPFPNPPATNLKRYHEIVSVLARHVFGSFLTDLQIEHRNSLPSRWLKQEILPPEHIKELSKQ
jgi:hypothetical protein